MNSIFKMLEELNEKKGINEIVINENDKVFIEREGEFIGLKICFKEDEINYFIDEIARFNHKICDEKNPILDGNLPDGSRVNIIRYPYAKNGTAITIRRYSENLFSFKKDFGKFKIPASYISFFRALVRSKKNILISGGTAVGKTSFMNMMLNEISFNHRIISIEDTIELNIQQPNVVRLESGTLSLDEDINISMRNLVRNSLRMRPDRIIIGEVRGVEVFDLFQAMNTGHSGVIASIHANSSIECLLKIEALFMMTGFDFPYHVIRKNISQSLDFIIQLEKKKNGERIVKQVLEVNGMEGNNILTSSILENDSGELVKTGVTPISSNDLIYEGDLAKDFFII